MCVKKLKEKKKIGGRVDLKKRWLKYNINIQYNRNDLKTLQSTKKKKFQKKRSEKIEMK